MTEVAIRTQLKRHADAVPMHLTCLRQKGKNPFQNNTNALPKIVVARHVLEKSFFCIFFVIYITYVYYSVEFYFCFVYQTCVGWRDGVVIRANNNSRSSTDCRIKEYLLRREWGRECVCSMLNVPI